MWQKIKKSFQNHPLQNSLITLILAAICFLGYKTLFGKAVVNGGVEKNNIVFLPSDLQDRYFIPDKQAVSTATTTGNQGAATKNKIDLTLADTLFQNLARNNFNVSTGIRQSSSPVGKSRANHIYAASKNAYPAVYFAEYINGQDKKIWETNVFTGEKKLVTEAKDTIGFLEFSQANQRLVYSTRNEQSKWSIFIYDLDKKQQETVIENINFANLRWSPDGKNLAFPALGNPGEKNRMAVYTLSTKNLKYYDINASMVDSRDLNWSDDGKTLIMRQYEQREPAGSLEKAIPFLLNLETGESKKVPEKVSDSEINWFATIIKNKIISFTEPVYDLKSPGFNTNYFHGWLSIFDMNSKTYQEYRDQTGDYMQQWILDSNLSKAVYVTGKEAGDKVNMTLKSVDLSTKEVKEFKINNFSNMYQLVGWNGNEDNVLIWDRSAIFYNVNIKTGVVTKITG